MAEEIERKYLVFNKLLPKLESGTRYIQGYLSFKPLIRFRMIGENVTINIKDIKKHGTTRDEWELSKRFSPQEVKKLIKLSQKKPIEKIRYRVKHKGLVWEIDVYQGDNKGLITADVELPVRNYQIEFPDWIDSSREITNNPRYFNINLGENPYKSWGNKKN